MTRKMFIERALRQIYGDQPSDDANITYGLVNAWLMDATALAAKQNWKDNIAIDGISYVNNSFYTIFKGLTITEDEQFLWKIELPDIPLGIGTTQGVSTLQFKDNTSREISLPVVWLSENQRTYYRTMTVIPNRVLAYPQGKFVYAKSTLNLAPFTAQVTMISSGDSTDLDSELNVPSDYYPIMVEYIKQQLMFERNVPQDVVNDGSDIITTT